MGIKSKLIIGFMLIVLSITLATFYGLIISNKNTTLFINSSENFRKDVDAAVEASSYAKRAEGHLNLYLMLKTEQDKKKFYARHKSLNEQIAKLEKIITNPAGIQQIELLKISSANILRFGNRLVEIHDSSPDTYKHINHKELHEGLHTAASSAREAGVQITKIGTLAMKERIKTTRNNILSLQRNIIIITAVICVTAFILSIVIAYSITKPLTEIQDAASAILKGNLNRRAKVTTNDEFAFLAETFNNMVNELHKTYLELEDNIIERKKTETALSESEKKFRNSFEYATIGMVMASINGQFMKVNNFMCDMLGYTNDELLQKTFMDITHPDDLNKDVSNIRKMIAGTINSFKMEKRYLHKHGNIVWVVLNASIIRGKTGEPKYFIAQIQNITDRKKAEQALTAAYQKLNDTQEQLIQAGKMTAIGQLAAGISHELNQPLTGIKGFAQMALDSAKTDSTLKADLEKIVGQADRMDKIIQKIRLFARKSEFIMAKIDINEPVKDSFMLLNTQLETHNITVKNRLAKDLPLIMGDANQLEQAFINLITNASDAIDSLKDSNGGEIILESSLSQDKGYLEITFKDTGGGISGNDLEHIFNPFYTTKAPDRGIGLGLSIVYRIIETHKGSIEVDSEEGKGTTFKITLPIA